MSIEVRVGLPGDAEAVADVQYRAWTTSYSEIVPADAMNQVDPTAAAIRWRDSMLNPPSPSHRVLVADEQGKAFGFVAFGPARDEQEAQSVGEIYILVVAPESTGQGVGPMLIEGACSHLRDDGFTEAVGWVLEADAPMRKIFEVAGWSTDAGLRDLDMGRPVPEVRLRKTPL